MTDTQADSPINEQMTGLPWPKTWKSAYVLVGINFLVWLALLLALKEFFK